MTRRMVMMLVALGLLFGGIFGYKAYKMNAQKKFMASPPPPAAVSTIKAEFTSWQPELKAVGTLRAVRGVDVTSEVSGLVSTVHFNSGDEVTAGQLLLQLNADTDVSRLRALEAAAELSLVVCERDRKQFAAQAISKAALDADEADLKVKRAEVAQQAAAVAKKTIRAPFAGRVGITTINPGHYVNPGDKIVTLQSLDSIYIDFYLPQQELARLSSGQTVIVTTDTYAGRAFKGVITTINPKVDPETRNILIEATIANPDHELLPGMYASAVVRAGTVQRYLTLPQTAVAFNPYGETVFIVEEGTKGPDGKPVLTARQAFVTVGPARGDQIAVLKGVREGETVISSGQLKLKNGSRILINNRIQPRNEAAPQPAEQ